jgi:hypothetical protein
VVSIPLFKGWCGGVPWRDEIFRWLTHGPTLWQCIH